MKKIGGMVFVDNIIRIVMLRRPRSDWKDMRSDPFWEFGSFGITGCHTNNIMHPKNQKKLEGTRLAFVQGGADAIRLVFITPPISVVEHKYVCEAKWNPILWPLRYDSAPIIINNSGQTEFPTFLKEFLKVKRTTLMGAFASKFRTRVQPLPDEVAKELLGVYNKCREFASRIAGCYTEAMPFLPGKIDCRRLETYQKMLKNHKI